MTDIRQLRAQLVREGSLRFSIASDSMTPLIQQGDTIEVIPLSDSPHRFDLVVFRETRGLVCHYVWHVNRSGSIVTRALAYPDGQDLPIDKEDLLGKVASHRLSGFQRLALALKARLAGRR